MGNFSPDRNEPISDVATQTELIPSEKPRKLSLSQVIDILDRAFPVTITTTRRFVFIVLLGLGACSVTQLVGREIGAGFEPEKNRLSVANNADLTDPRIQDIVEAEINQNPAKAVDLLTRFSNFDIRLTMGGRFASGRNGLFLMENNGSSIPLLQRMDKLSDQYFAGISVEKHISPQYLDPHLVASINKIAGLNMPENGRFLLRFKEGKGISEGDALPGVSVTWYGPDKTKQYVSLEKEITLDEKRSGASSTEFYLLVIADKNPRFISLQQDAEGNMDPSFQEVENVFDQLFELVHQNAK